MQTIRFEQVTNSLLGGIHVGKKGFSLCIVDVGSGYLEGESNLTLFWDSNNYAVAAGCGNIPVLRIVPI